VLKEREPLRGGTTITEKKAPYLKDKGGIKGRWGDGRKLKTIEDRRKTKSAPLTYLMRYHYSVQRIYSKGREKTKSNAEKVEKQVRGGGS